MLRYIAPTYRVLPPLTCFLAVLCVDRFQTAMFYSQIILAKKGALSKIWIAAHVSSKLKKDDIFKTDITEAVSLYRCFFFSFPFIEHSILHLFKGKYHHDIVYPNQFSLRARYIGDEDLQSPQAVVLSTVPGHTYPPMRFSFSFFLSFSTFSLFPLDRGIGI